MNSDDSKRAVGSGRAVQRDDVLADLTEADEGRGFGIIGAGHAEPSRATLSSQSEHAVTVEQPRPTLRLMNHTSLMDAVAFIEEKSGEKMTPEEVEELRQALGSSSSSTGERGT